MVNTFKNMNTDGKTQTVCIKQVQNGMKKFTDSMKNHRIWLDFNLMYCFCLTAKKNTKKIVEVIGKLDTNLLDKHLDMKARFIDIEIVCYEAMNKDIAGHQKYVECYVWCFDLWIFMLFYMYFLIVCLGDIYTISSFVIFICLLGHGNNIFN